MKERDAFGRELRHLQGIAVRVEREGEVEHEEKPANLSFATSWINSFPTCKQDLLDHCDDIAEGFGQAMQDGGHTWAIKLAQKKASPYDWMDAAHKGADDKAGRGADTVDMAMIASHGTVWPKKGDQPLHVSVGFDQTPCRFRSHQTRFGDGKLKWLILDSCRSLEMVEAEKINPWEIWRRSFDGLHQIFGFTGQSSDSWWTEDRGETFAFFMLMWDKEMADAWLDAASSWSMDDVPAVMAVGRTSEDARNRLETEKLSSSFSGIPRKDVTTAVWSWR